MKKYLIAAGVALMTSGPVAQAELVEYSCVTEAARDATLSFTVSGRIVEILHREGTKVEEGTPIVQLENRVEELDVQRRQLVMEDASELQAAKAKSEAMAKMAESTRRLFEATGSVSQEELAMLEVDASAAAADYSRLQIAEKRERVEYQLAVANLERRTLTAPFDGTIVDIKLSEGEISEANQPLVQLVQIERGFLLCNIEEPVGRNLSSGDMVPVAIQSGTGRWDSEGEVVFVAPVVDPASGLLRVKIEFDNSERIVRPGVPGYVSLESSNQGAGSSYR